MEVLFKDDNRIYYIRNNYLHSGSTERFLVKDLTNIPHLDEVDILYHYRNKETDELYPVYYEHNGRFITKDDTYYTWVNIYIEYTKDYTLVNLKLLEDGSNI